MPLERPRFDPLAFLTLSEVRRFIRTSRFRGAVLLFSLLYILGAAFESEMVVLAHFSGGYTSEIILSNPFDPQWWKYPALLVEAPWGAFELPFLPTFEMLVVGVGVGLGMTVALILAVRLARPTASERARSKAVGAFTGLTPAMLSLVTLGACCSTTAVATAGVGLVADVSATSVSNLMLNNWYLGLFQIVIVWVSLLAQELLLSVYGGLYGRAADVARPRVTEAPTRAWLATGALRAALFVAGLLWVLEVAADWTVTPLASAGAGHWFSWIVQHGVVGFGAIAFGLFPAGTLAALAPQRSSRVLRWLLLGSGLSLFLWFPPTFVAAGVHGLPNELFGAAGLAASPWGGVGVPGPSAALVFRWVGEFVLLGGCTILIALRPHAVRTWTVRGLPRALPVTDPSDGIPGACPAPETGAPAAVPTTSTGPEGM